MSRGDQRENIFLDDVYRHDFLETWTAIPAGLVHRRGSFPAAMPAILLPFSLRALLPKLRRSSDRANGKWVFAVAALLGDKLFGRTQTTLYAFALQPKPLQKLRHAGLRVLYSAEPPQALPQRSSLSVWKISLERIAGYNAKSYKCGR